MKSGLRKRRIYRSASQAVSRMVFQRYCSFLTQSVLSILPSSPPCFASPLIPEPEHLLTKTHASSSLATGGTELVLIIISAFIFYQSCIKSCTHRNTNASSMGKKCLLNTLSHTHTHTPLMRTTQRKHLFVAWVCFWEKLVIFQCENTDHGNTSGPAPPEHSSPSFRFCVTEIYHEIAPT